MGCRVWRPGPEDGRLEEFSSWKRVYLEFGFVFIQDMVERALMEEIVAAGEGRGEGAQGGVDSIREGGRESQWGGGERVTLCEMEEETICLSE